MNPNTVRKNPVAQTSAPESIQLSYAAAEVRKEWSLKTPPGFPKRYIVPLPCKDWRIKYPEYAPVVFTAPSVLKNALGPLDQRYADTPDISPGEITKRICSGEMKSYEGEILLDSTSGLPLNPSGRTGIQGRGGWGKWGPNHAADAMLVRLNPETNKLEVLLILRRTGEWALPGGMVNKNETGQAAALRELEEETTVAIPNLNPKIVFEGAVRLDPRDADNAWAETTLAASYIGVEGMTIQLKAGDDAAKTNWFEINEELLATLYSNHGSLIRMGVERLTEDLPQAVRLLCAAQLSALAHEPLRTTLQGLQGKIGIFGGTFDPLHEGHIKLARAAQKWHGLDYVIFVPTDQSPLKANAPIASNLQRLMMLREVLTSEPSWFVTPLQQRQTELGYTVDLVETIQKEVAPGATLFTLVGGDCIGDFQKWKQIEKLRKISKITPVLRKGIDFRTALAPLSEPLRAELTQSLVPAEIPPFAGTFIRQSIEANDTQILAEALPASVKNFVEKFRLYGCP